MSAEKNGSGLVTGLKRNTARTTTAVFGVLAGLGGITHGVGEVLQGSVAPESVFIYSWTQGPIASNMGGEPGMTLIPDMLLTGIACLAVGAALVLVSATLDRWKRGGLAVLLLAVALMLTGGGFGPPAIGILAGIAGLKADRARVRTSAEKTRAPGSVAKAWPWLFGVAAASGTFLVIGSVVLVYAIDLNVPEFFVMNFLFTLVVLAATVIAARATTAAGPSSAYR